MLPVEIIKLITNELETYRNMLSFLSISKHYLETRNFVPWNKGLIRVNNSIYKLPYYHQFTSVTLNSITCIEAPKNVETVYTMRMSNPFKLKAFIGQTLLKLSDLHISPAMDVSYINYLFYFKMFESVSIDFFMTHSNQKKIIWPKELKTLRLQYVNILEARYLPINLEKLIIHQCDYIGRLPCNLKELYINDIRDNGMSQGLFLSSLKKLSINDLQIQPNVLPEGLEELELIGRYNQPILFQSIPKTVKKITFGDKFNQYLDMLPDNIEIIHLGKGYTHLIVGQILPKNIKEIHLHLEEHIIYHFGPTGYYIERLMKHNDKPQKQSIWESICNFFTF